MLCYIIFGIETCILYIKSLREKCQNILEGNGCHNLYILKQNEKKEGMTRN